MLLAGDSVRYIERMGFGAQTPARNPSVWIASVLILSFGTVALEQRSGVLVCARPPDTIQ